MKHCPCSRAVLNLCELKILTHQILVSAALTNKPFASGGTASIKFDVYLASTSILLSYVGLTSCCFYGVH